MLAQRIMIWNSVPLMTAIDLIIAVALYSIWRCRRFIPGRRPSASRTGETTSEQEAMALMGALHRQLSWLTVLLTAITISSGFVKLLSELHVRLPHGGDRLLHCIWSPVDPNQTSSSTFKRDIY
jgi:hypothetical protein